MTSILRENSIEGVGSILPMQRNDPRDEQMAMPLPSAVALPASPDESPALETVHNWPESQHKVVLDAIERARIIRNNHLKFQGREARLGRVIHAYGQAAMLSAMQSAARYQAEQSHRLADTHDEDH